MSPDHVLWDETPNLSVECFVDLVTGRIPGRITYDEALVYMALGYTVAMTADDLSDSTHECLYNRQVIVNG